MEGLRNLWLVGWPPPSVRIRRDMEFHVMAKSYNCYGGHTTLSLIGSFLMMGCEDFGDALEEITVTLNLPSAGPPKKTLEHLFERHYHYCQTLPKITFRRAKGKIDIEVVSDLMEGRSWKPSPEVSLPQFQKGCEEVIQALSLLKKRVKGTDSFDLDSFLSHCHAARARIPNSTIALEELAATIRSKDEEKRNALSPWEKLGIDWEEYHPSARDKLDDPFFWSATDDFSPNGNDTGADILDGYRDWLRGPRKGRPVLFLQRTARQWGFLDLESMDQEIYDDAVVGLAYADIKLRGQCDRTLGEMAMKSVKRQKVGAQEAAEWPYRKERLKSLALIEEKLLENLNLESK